MGFDYHYDKLIKIYCVKLNTYLQHNPIVITMKNIKSLLLATCQGIAITTTLALFLSASLNAEHDHDNQVYFYLFDQYGNPLHYTDDTRLDVSGPNQVADGQNPHGNEPISWKYTGSNQIMVSWEVGRNQKGSAGQAVAEGFGGILENEGGTHIGPTVTQYNSDDNDDNTYYPQAMNFWMTLTMDDMVIPFTPSGSSESATLNLTVPNLVMGQYSESLLKALVDVGKAIGETVYDSDKLAGEVAEDDPDIVSIVHNGVKVLKGVGNIVSSIVSAFDNYWIVGQRMVGFTPTNASSPLSIEPYYPPDGESVIQAALDSNYPVIIATGVYSFGSVSNELRPVLITPGSDDHKFNVYVIVPYESYDSGSSAPGSQTTRVPGSLFADARHVVKDWFLDPSLGLFQRTAGSDWIDALLLGWLYPDPNGNYDPELWLYCNEDDDWIYISKDTPGALFRKRTNGWYVYDPVQERMIPQIPQ